MIHLLLLHGGATLSLAQFSVHPSTAIGIAVLAALYAARTRRGYREGRRVGRTAPALFAGALVTLFFALNGWIHDLSDYYLFSAHMVQHLLLALVVAPLFVAGTPGWMLEPALRWRGIAPAARWATHPFRTFVIFNVVFAAWHLPVLYNLAMQHHDVHIVQHLMFLVASVLMWWPLLSPVPELPRLAYPMQMLYVFLLSIAMSIVSVYIVYADSLLYPAYASAPRIWTISPMQDQLIGGLIMWIPGGLYFLAVISLIFFLWQRESAERDMRVPHPRRGESGALPAPPAPEHLPVAH
jgi:putative membrane protein